MISNIQLESEFLLVREKIFPRWDKDKVWSISFGNFTGSPEEQCHECRVSTSALGANERPFTSRIVEDVHILWGRPPGFKYSGRIRCNRCNTL